MLLHEVSLLLAALAGFLSALCDDRLSVERRSSSPHVLAVFLCLLTYCGLTSGLEHGVVTVLAEAGSDVILPCSLGNQDIQSRVFDWKKDGAMEVFLYDGRDEYNNGRPGQSVQFRGRVSHFKDQLKHGNASISIRNTKMADSGDYTCIFPLLQTGSQTQHVQLVVGCDPPCSPLKNKYGEADGAAPEPSISIVSVTDIAVELECVVRGASPRPELEWRDGDGNVLRADEPRVSSRGDVSLQTSVTTTSTNQASTSTSTYIFICVATQKKIDHQINANITLTGKLFQNTRSKVDVTGWIGGTFLGICLVLAVQAVLVKLKLFTIGFKKAAGSLQEEAGLNERDVKKPLQEDRERDIEGVREGEGVSE